MVIVQTKSTCTVDEEDARLRSKIEYCNWKAVFLGWLAIGLVFNPLLHEVIVLGSHVLCELNLL